MLFIFIASVKLLLFVIACVWIVTLILGVIETASRSDRNRVINLLNRILNRNSRVRHSPLLRLREICEFWLPILIVLNVLLTLFEKLSSCQILLTLLEKLCNCQCS
ncbi:hypothetical protein NIES4106_35710 [Fischerella sp. NIES-4106]|jgi:hypothetical protein|nr:hypothetical protein NIES4106_35710 [Fischerella sp. NIES-4106]